MQQGEDEPRNAFTADDQTRVYTRSELQQELQQGTQAIQCDAYSNNPRQGRPSMLDERQRAIIRQHSQSMALEVLKLKVTLNELTVEDLTPAKLTSLANYFDADVIGAAQ